MDSKKRILVKSVTWQLSGLVTMTLISLMFSGSLTTSIGIAAAGMLSGFVFYVLHEMLWSKISWGRRS